MLQCSVPSSSPPDRIILSTPISRPPSDPSTRSQLHTSQQHSYHSQSQHTYSHDQHPQQQQQHHFQDEERTYHDHQQQQIQEQEHQYHEQQQHYEHQRQLEEYILAASPHDSKPPNSIMATPVARTLRTHAPPTPPDSSSRTFPHHPSTDHAQSYETLDQVQEAARSALGPRISSTSPSPDPFAPPTEHNSNTHSNSASNQDSKTHTDTVRTPNVYINGLPPNFPDAQLRALASSFGSVLSVRTFTRHVSDRPSGYGFVLFDGVDAAERCITELRRYRNLHPSFSKQVHRIPGTPFAQAHPPSSSPQAHSHLPSDSSISTSSTDGEADGSELRGRGRDRESFKQRMEQLRDADSTNLYIEGLPISIDLPTLSALVSPYVIKSSRFFQTKLSAPPRIIAFVRLETHAAAKEIIERLHGRTVRGWNDPIGSRIAVRFADNNEQRELRRAERLERSGNAADEEHSPVRLSMAQAALLNLRGHQLQIPNTVHQQPPDYTKRSMSRPLGYDNQILSRSRATADDYAFIQAQAQAQAQAEALAQAQVQAQARLRLERAVLQQQQYAHYHREQDRVRDAALLESFGALTAGDRHAALRQMQSGGGVGVGMDMGVGMGVAGEMRLGMVSGMNDEELAERARAQAMALRMGLGQGRPSRAEENVERYPNQNPNPNQSGFAMDGFSRRTVSDANASMDSPSRHIHSASLSNAGFRSSSMPMSGPQTLPHSRAHAQDCTYDYDYDTAQQHLQYQQQQQQQQQQQASYCYDISGSATPVGRTSSNNGHPSISLPNLSMHIRSSTVPSHFGLDNTRATDGDAPMVSPALTYGSRTPSTVTLSPTTPFFGAGAFLRDEREGDGESVHTGGRVGDRDDVRFEVQKKPRSGSR